MDWVIPASLERADLEAAAAQLATGASSDDQDLRLMCGLCSLALDVLNSLTLRHGRPRVRAAVRSVLLGLAQELPSASQSPSAGERLQRAAERVAAPSYLAITAANCVPAVLRARDILEDASTADDEGVGLPGLAAAASAVVAGAGEAARAPRTPDRRQSGSSGADDHRAASAGILMLGSPLDSSFNRLDCSGPGEHAAGLVGLRAGDLPESPTTPPRPSSSSPARDGVVIASSRTSPSARGWGAEIPDSAVGVSWPGPHDSESHAWRATATSGARSGELREAAGVLLGTSGSTDRDDTERRGPSRSRSPARSRRSSLGSVGAHQRRLPIFGDGLMRRSKPGTREYEIEMAAERRRRMLDYGNARSRAAGEVPGLERHVAGEDWGRDAGRVQLRAGRTAGPSSTSAAPRRGRAPRALGRVGTTSNGERPVPDGSFMEDLPGRAARSGARKHPVSATARIVSARQVQPVGASEAATPDPSHAETRG